MMLVDLDQSQISPRKQKTEVATFDGAIAYEEDISTLRDRGGLTAELYEYFIKVYASRLPLPVYKVLEVIRGNTSKSLKRSKGFVVFDTNVMFVDQQEK